VRKILDVQDYEGAAYARLSMRLSVALLSASRVVVILAALSITTTKGSDDKAPTETLSTCLPAGGYYKLPVAAGDYVVVKASVDAYCGPIGWSCDSWRTHSGPEGVAGYIHTGALIPTAAIGTLVGGFSPTNFNTASDPPQDVWGAIHNNAQVFGAGREVTAPAVGFLYLIFNDIPAYFDNAGAVRIEVQHPSAATFDAAKAGVVALRAATANQ
jgi:hypothetical protein